MTSRGVRNTEGFRTTPPTTKSSLPFWVTSFQPLFTGTQFYMGRMLSRQPCFIEGIFFFTDHKHFTCFLIVFTVGCFNCCISDGPWVIWQPYAVNFHIPFLQMTLPWPLLRTELCLSQGWFQGNCSDWGNKWGNKSHSIARQDFPCWGEAGFQRTGRPGLCKALSTCIMDEKMNE